MVSCLQTNAVNLTSNSSVGHTETGLQIHILYRRIENCNISILKLKELAISLRFCSRTLDR